MRLAVIAVGFSFLLVACSDDTKQPTVDSKVTGSEAKVGDGPATKTEASTADKGGSTGDKGSTAKDGAASGGIGPAGGQAKSSDGEFTLDVPAGALTATINFEISKPAVNPPASVVTTWTELTGVKVDGATKSVSVEVSTLSCKCVVESGGQKTVKKCYQVKPHKTTFSKPAKVTFSNIQLGDAGYQVFSTQTDCPLPM